MSGIGRAQTGNAGVWTGSCGTELGGGTHLLLVSLIPLELLVSGSSHWLLFILTPRASSTAVVPSLPFKTIYDWLNFILTIPSNLWPPSWFVRTGSCSVKVFIILRLLLSWFNFYTIALCTIETIKSVMKSIIATNMT